MTAGLVHASLDEALRWVGSELPTGSLRVHGACPGSIFFDQGRLYFATVDNRPMSGADLADAGIDRTLWQRASTGADARLNFVTELLAAGCDRRAIERFVLHRLEKAIDEIGLESGPVEIGRGRHGFGAAISFSPAQLDCLAHHAAQEQRTLEDDALVSLVTVNPTTSVSLDGRTWNALAQLFSPARFAEIREVLGSETAATLTAALTTRSLIGVVEPHRSEDPWRPPPPTAVSPPRLPAAKPALFDDEPPAASIHAAAYDDEDDDEYVPDRVGRQAYAAMASMRASVAEPPAPEKARALRRLIEAVKGL